MSTGSRVEAKRGPKKGDHPYFVYLDWYGLSDPQPADSRQEAEEWAARHREAADKIRRHIEKQAVRHGQSVDVFVRDIVMPRLDRDHQRQACAHFFSRESSSDGGPCAAGAPDSPDPLWTELMSSEALEGDQPKYKAIKCVRIPDRIPTADAMLDDIDAAGLATEYVEAEIFNLWMEAQATLASKMTGETVFKTILSVAAFKARYYGDKAPDRLRGDDDDD